MIEVNIEALRPFNRTPQGDLCETGDVFPVSASRADELKRLGLARRSDTAAEEPEADQKSAPTPSNKIAPRAANKAVTSKAIKLGGGV